MSRQGKWEYLKATYALYHQAPSAEKSRTLDEFCQARGYHRKSALRLLNGPPRGRRPPPRRGRASYPTGRRGQNAPRLHVHQGGDEVLAAKAGLDLPQGLQALTSVATKHRLPANSSVANRLIN